MRWSSVVLGLVLVLLAGVVATAHQINISTARIDLGDDGTVTVEIGLRGSDADRAAGSAIFDAGSGLVAKDRLAAAAAPIIAYVAAHTIVISGDAKPCQTEPGATAAPDQDGVTVRIRWSCANASGLVYRSTVLMDVDPGARQIVLVHDSHGEWQALLDRREMQIALTNAAVPSPAQIVGRYLAAGIEHIFLGYDHIAFLIAVMLWARRLWPVVKIVTAFTVAHSITLSLAALGILRIPSAIIEPAIAASIVYVAVENFVSRNVGQRWRDTFAFGLVHGFGFASALEELGLPRSALAGALASFNIGVEIGQIAIVSLVLPAMLLIDRLSASPRAEQIRRPAVVYSISGAIILLGGYWFLARTVLA